jgi:chromosome segregation ATPase
MEDFIDAAIAAGITASEAQPEAIENADAPITEEAPAPESDEPSEPAEKDEPFPKKAINALSRRDKQIGKLRAQTEQMQAELKALREANTPKQTTGEPKETDFANYHEYIRAVNKYDSEKLLAERDSKQQETQKVSQSQAWETERLTEIDKQSAEFAKETPEVTALFDEYADVIREYPPEIKRLFLEADNAPLAFYNLAKEGKIEALGEMSLAKAAMEIGRAQTQAATKTKTKAPTPLPASRGSAAAGKSVNDMATPEEFFKWYSTS